MLGRVEFDTSGEARRLFCLPHEKWWSREPDPGKGLPVTERFARFTEQQTMDVEVTPE